MARTNRQRYDRTIQYLRGLDQALGTDVDSKINNKDDAGSRITLANEGFWYSGSSAQHHAVRAYLLCLLAYFRPPFCPQDQALGALPQERTRLKGKPEAQVTREILSFLPDPNATLVKVVQDAETRVTQPGALAPWWAVRTRDDNYVGPNPICYDGVKAWLFSSGWVSKRWLARTVMLDGNNSNQFLGDGEVVAEANRDKIPAGYVWNIHKRGDKTTCHWGVSLGGDRAAACNNTDAGVLRYERGGNTRYGRFPFTQICGILEEDARYQLPGRKNNPLGNIIVRQINPGTIANR